MRLQKKYKNFSKLNAVFSRVPLRILKFHRTKWKKIQQLISKKIKKKNLFSCRHLLFTKKWIFYNSKYSFGVYLKKYFDCIFDKAFSLLFFKKLKFLNKKLKKNIEYSIYLIRPEFRIDIFFWRLNFFSSCYEARVFINNKKILINNKSVHSNYFLKKGDIISLKFFTCNNKLKLKSFNNFKIFSFVEIDYYTNTVVILKDYITLTEKDLRFFFDSFVDINKFKSFIK